MPTWYSTFTHTQVWARTPRTVVLSRCLPVPAPEQPTRAMRKRALLHRVRVHSEEHSKPWRVHDQKEKRKVEWLMHPEENYKCATTAQLCFCVDTELSLSVEPQSLHWWSHLSFVKHKATMVDRKETTTKKRHLFYTNSTWGTGETHESAPYNVVLSSQW